MVVVLQSEVLEDLVHGLGHAAVELRTLDRLVRADLLVVTPILKKATRKPGWKHEKQTPVLMLGEKIKALIWESIL